jgi:hypothetical protein
MSEAEVPFTAPPELPWFQFTLRTLFLVFVVLASSLAVFGAWGIMVFLLALGLAVYLHKVRSLASGAAYAVLAALCLMCVLCLPALDAAKMAGRQAQCKNNLKQIALALQSYRMAKGHFPPAYIADKNGKPMHSWRVLLLPYLDMDSAYKQYNFNEPWDGPNNKKLAAIRVPMYECPSDPNWRRQGPPQTNYLAVVGPGAAWKGKTGKKPGDITGRLSDTIMVVEVADSGIAWTEPRDLSLETLGVAGTSSSALARSSHHGPQSDFFFIYDSFACANVAMADGDVRYLPPGSLSAERLSKLLQIGGCEASEFDSNGNLCQEHRRPNWPNIAALAVWLISVAALLARAVRSRPKTNAGTPIINH